MKNTTKWTTAQIPSQTGKRIIITGANSGIGFFTALELARAGAQVVLPSRTVAKAEDAAGRIRRLVPAADVQPEVLDLAELASVRAFAARAGDQPLDILVNNAGVMAVPRREVTVDGYERQFATNFLGPFALTALLLPALLKAAEPRVTTVSSGLANDGKINFDDLQSERKYRPLMGAYAQSKLADLLFTLELQRRANAAGVHLISTAASPGYAITNLQATLTGAFRIVTAILKPLFSQDAAAGALPTLYAAVAPETQPGGYYGPDGPMNLKGSPTALKVPARARDVAVAKRLWTEAERLTGVTFGALAGN